MLGRMTTDPRLRVLYLSGVAVGAFLVRDLRVLAAIVVAHALLWVVLGEGVRALARQVFKLWAFAAFVIGSYALTAEDPAIDQWVPVAIAGHTFSINRGGALVGAAMMLRILVLVLASRVARAGDSRAIA